MVDLRALRYFVAVAEHLNFSEAAKELFVAQPAVSQQIGHLEKQLGVRLFYRDKHSVRLTAAGAVLLQDAREILEKVSDSVERVRWAEHGMVGTVKIGALSAPVRTLLPRLIRRIRATHPGIQLLVNFYQVGHILEHLRADSLDMAFTLSMGLENLGGLARRVLGTEPHCVIVPYDHPLAGRDRVSMAELRHERFVMLDRQESPPGFDLVLAACKNHGFSPNIVNSASRVDAVLMLVDAGLGIAILPRYLQVYAASTVRFIELEGDELQVDVVCVWKRTNDNPSLRLVVDEMQSMAD